MAAPLSGIGGQQIPLSQPFQPGGSDQTREIRQRNQEPRETELQTREAAPARSQATNAERSGEHFANASNDDSGSTAQGRGSVVDIVI